VDHPSTREQISEPLTDPGSRLPRVPADLATKERLGVLLREHGCVVIDSLFSDSLATVRSELERVLAAGRLGDNDFDGYATRRVFDPLARTRVLDKLLLHDLLAATVNALIGPAQLGMTVLTEIGPGQAAQRLHRDASVYPLPPGTGPVMVNTIWAIDDFTADNGATIVAPGSHLEATRPAAYDPARLVPAEMGAGSVLVYDGRLVHGAGSNDTSSGRVGLIIEHVVRWLRPGDNHSLTVPPEVAVALPARLQELLGYNQHGSYFGFVAGRPPRDWLIDNFGSRGKRPDPAAES
jgi:ectoine hydroxylase-related dioxygenase (phytanoyl-CoA dioxygenase family)